MTTKRNKTISLILSMVLLISIFPQIIFAKPPNVYMEDGFIKMSFENKKAQTGTRFKTVGWIVHPSFGDGRAANTQKYGKMIDKDFKQIDEKENIPGTLTTYFEIKEDIVSQAFVNAGLGDLHNGEPVFLDSVFTVTHNGVSNGKYYYTLKDIQNAAPWGSQTMKDLENYFDIPITFESGEYPVYQDYFVNGQKVEHKEVAKLKAGDPFIVTYPETYTTKEGKIATLKYSQEYYNLLKGYYLNIKDYPDQAALKRKMNNPIGGLTHEGKYIVNPTIKVEHMDKDKNVILKEYEKEVLAGDTFSASSEDFSPLQYIYSEISNDGGKTWKQRSDKKTRNIIANSDAIIRFYYSKDTDIMADLKIIATPDTIQKGSTATVKFVLDARGSKSKYPIEKWEFWFGDDKEADLSGDPAYTIDKATKEVIENDVKPSTTWYGKVRITDNRGTQATAEYEVTIKEKQEDAKVQANIDVEFYRSSKDASNLNHLVDYIDHVEMVEDDKKFPDSKDRPAMVVYVNKPDDLFMEDGTARYGFDFDIEVSGKRSKSSNGIGKTEIYYNYNSSEQVMQEGDSFSKATTFEKKALDHSDATWMWGQLETNNYDWVSKNFALKAYDSVDTSKSDMAKLTVYFVGIPGEEDSKEQKPPTVNLEINQKIFMQGEKAIFTPSFYEEENKTYSILDKSWEIGAKSTEYKVEGKGEIPKEYLLDFGVGKYYARQYIYYKDQYGNDMSDFSEVEFEVVGRRDPDVAIKSDKEKYYIPTTGYFTVTYDEDPKFTYYIADRQYKLKNENGTLITKGEGTFPSEYFFNENLPGGFYYVEQTIYWWVEGEYKSKTASCKFKLISPIPSAEFEVNMKMSVNPNDWLRIDVPGESGKQFKQIRIDLTPSIELNEALENPYPIDFKNPNTQIQVLPLTDDLQADREKNKVIHTPISSDKELIDNTITFKGKQYIDVRFDKPGKYRIKTRVANEKYTGSWLVRDILIRKDLPPKVDLSFGDIFIDGNQNKVYRTTEDLRVRFKVYTSAISQDDDSVNADSAKLEVKFDHNSDNDTSNDGLHSSMFLTTTNKNLQPYINITKNNSMNEFFIDMYDNNSPILGKIRFEYSIGETPKIPNFIGGNMPNIPNILGTTYSIPIERKIVLADNKPGNIKVEVGKDSKIEITILMGSDSLHFDLDTLKSYYGKDAKIYLIDKNGNRHLLH